MVGIFFLLLPCATLLSGNSFLLFYFSIKANATPLQSPFLLFYFYPADTTFWKWEIPMASWHRNWGAELHMGCFSLHQQSNYAVGVCKWLWPWHIVAASSGIFVG